MIHPLDHLFRKKLRDRTFHPGDDDWKQALALLEAQEGRRKRKALPFWWWFAGVLFLGGVAIFQTTGSRRATPVEPEKPGTIGPASAATENNSIYQAENKESIAPLDARSAWTEKSAPTYPEQAGNKIGIRPEQVPVQVTPPATQRTSPSPVQAPADANAGDMPVETIAEARSFTPVSSEKDQEQRSTGETARSSIPMHVSQQLASPDFLPVNMSDLLWIDESPITLPAWQEVAVHQKIPAAAAPVLMGIRAGGVAHPISGTGRGWLRGIQGGVTFTQSWNQRWYSQLDIGYSRISGALPYTKENQAVHYSFGRLAFENRLQPTALHFWNGSVSLYRKWKRHAVGISAGYSHLAAVRGMITHTGAEVPEGDTTAYDTSLWIKKDGFSRWQIPLDLNWQYELSPRLTAHLYLGYQWRPLADPQYAFLPQTTGSPTGHMRAGIGLRFDLFALQTVIR